MILTTIDGIPLYSTPQEALDWGSQNNVQGYHTHMYNGQPGYMGGATHANAVASFTAPNTTSTPSTQTVTSSGGGY
tara:strand:+ start:271 stop:498 length:228 start_codon:yes stop_codon:yes gene_type:complete